MKKLCTTATSTSYLKTHRTPTDKPTKSCTAHKQRTSNKDSSSTSTKDLIQFTTNQNLCQCWTWWSSNTSKYSIDVRNDAFKLYFLIILIYCPSSIRFPSFFALFAISISFPIYFCFLGFRFRCLDFYHLYFLNLLLYLELLQQVWDVYNKNKSINLMSIIIQLQFKAKPLPLSYHKHVKSALYRKSKILKMKMKTPKTEPNQTSTSREHPQTLTNTPNNSLAESKQTHQSNIAHQETIFQIYQ